ncbi:GGDEF domain-containing protein [Chryseomicrobium palamuruense]|uniref:GGDEF domain-containing protein n=1 Tax=Chryseomicrobium palamuruense TaxID=682973 RepID=A0ABV8UV96_9BACL
MALSESYIQFALYVYGDEEFVILLPHATQQEGLYLATTIRERLEKSPVVLTDGVLSITVSIGIAEGKMNQPSTPNQLMSNADKALYSAKDKGRNRVEVY